MRGDCHHVAMFWDYGHHCGHIQRRLDYEAQRRPMVSLYQPVVDRIDAMSGVSSGEPVGFAGGPVGPDGCRARRVKSSVGSYHRVHTHQ